MLTSRDIRQQFIDFFTRKHAHTFVPSSPVVPHDDPTLLFTNAGMNQFKPIFLGQEKRDYSRAVNTQKCIRAGGKHNDLDDVGRSRRHHTFFEMLGNWSFGDYFKQGAIEMSWELLTQVWKLDPRRLHVSCFEGDEANGVPRDTEAADIWRKVANWEQFGLKSDDHIHYFGKDNFWEMGDTGPCGPCTEIYIDRRPIEEIEADRAAGRRSPVNGEDPRVMEIWNNVFIQYNRNADRSLVTLPAQHVDTGMGFERITQVLQNVESNYEIDLFNPFWARLKELSGFDYKGTYPKTNAADPAAEAASAQLRHDIAFRVIADHIRCLTFALTDGAVPSNEGRGYVLRRILRRAVRFGRQQLGLKDPFLYTLVDVVVEAMGEAFPELKKNPQHVKELIKDEEISFGKTLDRGIDRFNTAAALAFHAALVLEQSQKPKTERLSAALGGRGGSSQEEIDRELTDWSVQGILPFVDRSRISIFDANSNLVDEIKLTELSSAFASRFIHQTIQIDGMAAFQLHDTFGFPIDLTTIMAAERGMSVDLEGYERLMEEAREKARAGGRQGASAVYDLPPAALAEIERTGHARTDDRAKFEAAPISARIVAIWNGSNLDPSVDTAEDQEVALVLDRTNHYAEMGGQVGDRGTISTASANFDVQTTRVIGQTILHIGQITHGTLHVGEPVTVTVSTLRKPTQQHHTATHLANWALREVLGDAVQQKGSLVDPTKLRFDFSYGKALSDDELARVESLTNDQIAAKLPVYWQEAPQEQAQTINGLRAVFGEKYPPMVRVVSVGASVDDLISAPDRPDWRKHSIEFCGGTHVANTGEIGSFVITSEESVSKGIRRIVALAGNAASAAIEATRALDAEIDKARAADPSALPALINALQKQSGSDTLPLRAKRRAQQAIAELQAKFKAFEKQQKQAGVGSIDAGAIASDLIAQAGGGAIVANIDGITDDQLRSVMDSIKARLPSHAALLTTTSEGKVSIVAIVSDDLVKKGLKAGDWVRDVAKACGGGGGGRPNMAQAGGKDPTKIEEALSVARTTAANALAG